MVSLTNGSMCDDNDLHGRDATNATAHSQSCEIGGAHDASRQVWIASSYGAVRDGVRNSAGSTEGAICTRTAGFLTQGVIPAPGLTYGNLVINYSASSLNDASGNHRPNVVGSYGFWVDENIFFFVPKAKIFGGYFAPYISINPASGSLVASITGTEFEQRRGRVWSWRYLGRASEYGLAFQTC